MEQIIYFRTRDTELLWGESNTLADLSINNVFITSSVVSNKFVKLVKQRCIEIGGHRTNGSLV